MIDILLWFVIVSGIIWLMYLVISWITAIVMVFIAVILGKDKEWEEKADARSDRKAQRRREKWGR